MRVKSYRKLRRVLQPEFKKFFFVFIAYVFIITACNDQAKRVQPDMELWYEQPAALWVEALPVGNGRLGAMVFGDPLRERLQLNEESLWAGSPVNNNNTEALEHLPALRQLLFEDKVEEAQELVARHFIGTPPRIRSFQTAGDLFLLSDSVSQYEGYRRSLNLETGIASVIYETGGVTFKREVFVSAPSDVMVIHLTASEKQSINLTVSLEREKDAVTESRPDGMLVMKGQIIDDDDPLRGPGGKHMKFAATVTARNTGGEVFSGDGKLKVTNASTLTLIYTAATNYDHENLGFHIDYEPVNDCLRITDRLKDRSYSDLRYEHINDHSAMFNRVKLDLGGSEMAAIPTDKRLALVKEGNADPHLVNILFQYGRYLLMGSSRSPGVLPANLQGLWNEHFNAPWNSDFHTNINLQMNYWPAEVTNLPETVDLLSGFMKRLSVPGEKTATEMYGAQGWTFHHLTDPFGRTGVMDGPWGLTPMCGPWMTFPLWRHYAYSLDKKYLEEIAYPLIKGSALFILDFMTESPGGFMVTNPSHSPENDYFLPETKKAVTLTYGATMDNQIAREVLGNAVEAAALLQVDEEFSNRCKDALERLPEMQIGKDGTIMEWIKDYDEPEPGHRHISHLLGLYPLHQINPGDTRLFEAAAKTIEKRLLHGGGHTGWSRAWIINFYNRLYNGEKAYENLMEALETTILDNLLGTHPPFQIDGNFGVTAGIAGMFIDSAPGTTDILPSLPDQWEDGSVEGLRAHGGFTFDIFWKAGELQQLRINSPGPGSTTIRYKEKTYDFTADQKQTVVMNGQLEIQN